MSKTIALSLVIAASLGLSACGKSETTNVADAMNNAAVDANAAAANAMNAAGNTMDNAANAMGNAANVANAAH